MDATECVTPQSLSAYRVQGQMDAAAGVWNPPDHDGSACPCYRAYDAAVYDLLNRGEYYNIETKIDAEIGAK